MSEQGAIVVWRPGPGVSTQDVATGLECGLQAFGVEVTAYHTGVWYRLAKESFLPKLVELGAPTACLEERQVWWYASSFLATEALVARAQHGAEWIVAISGMYQHPDYYVLLKQAGFRVALLLTESPYMSEQERILAGLVDCVFTNERAAVPALQAVNPYSSYLPHAWNRATHDPALPVPEDVPSHDVVFVGTYFEERIQFLAAIDWTGIDLGLYGSTVQITEAAADPALPADVRAAAARLVPYIRGAWVDNARTAQLYRRARVNVNVFRTSKGFTVAGDHIAVSAAESLNPRCYELAALGAFFVSTPRAELAEKLPAVPTFETAAACEALIRRALADAAWRQGIAAANQAAVAADCWDRRARQVLRLLSLVPVRAAAA